MKQIEKLYLDRVANLGCVVCRNLGLGPTPAQIHHIREGQGLSQRASHFLVIPLCLMHHNFGQHGESFHAGPERFEAKYGSELELLAQTFEEIFNHR